MEGGDEDGADREAFLGGFAGAVGLEELSGDGGAGSGAELAGG